MAHADLLSPATLTDPQPFVIAGREFRSRLMVGTGKYSSNAQMIEAIEASGAEVVTVAVRRVDLDRSKDEGILHHLDPDHFFLLANTAGCYTAGEAIRYARLARAAGFNEWVKLEVIGDQQTLLPDTIGLLEATKTLVDEGFKVLAYTNDDLITALKLEDAGAVAVMPLASPIGSGLGMLNPIVMEQGVDGILMNTGIAAAQDPVRMAAAMKVAVEGGRHAYLAGRMPRREVAVPSSPTTGMLEAGA